MSTPKALPVLLNLGLQLILASLRHLLDQPSTRAFFTAKQGLW